uniref:Putative polyketide synthase n=1 Tax=blood disease bacterium R229 TaxID=741978 RepID=G2ZIX9_9RALS|nr:putative polyketide synthase [blood disease bacterium R229]
MRAAVAEGHELGVHVVVLIRKGTLPRTTSGKVRRAAVREAWLAGTLQTLWQDGIDGLAAPTPAQEAAGAPAAADTALLSALAPLDAAQRKQHLVQWLASRAAASLGTVAARAIRPEASLFGYGLDSLSATRLAAVAAAASGLALPDNLLFDHPSLDSLAGWLLQAMEHAQRLPAAPAFEVRDVAAPAPRPAAPRHGNDRDPVAVIGMAFRLPGENGRDADSDAVFWSLLDRAGCAIRPMPAERFRTPGGMAGVRRLSQPRGPLRRRLLRDVAARIDEHRSAAAPAARGGMACARRRRTAARRTARQRLGRVRRHRHRRLRTPSLHQRRGHAFRRLLGHRARPCLCLAGAFVYVFAGRGRWKAVDTALFALPKVPCTSPCRPCARTNAAWR